MLVCGADSLGFGLVLVFLVGFLSENFVNQDLFCCKGESRPDWLINTLQALDRSCNDYCDYSNFS